MIVLIFKLGILLLLLSHILCPTKGGNKHQADLEGGKSGKSPNNFLSTMFKEIRKKTVLDVAGHF